MVTIDDHPAFPESPLQQEIAPLLFLNKSNSDQQQSHKHHRWKGSALLLREIGFLFYLPDWQHEGDSLTDYNIQC